MSEKQITEDVKDFISKFSNYPLNRIREDHILSRTPLNMDNAQLNYLALALRGYVKFHKPGETVLARELKKSNLTVGQVCELIFHKITAKG